MQSRAPDFAGIGARVAACARIDTAWVFGSVARGDATEASDLDLAVLVHGDTGDDADLRALAADLEAFSPSGRVDVVVLGQQGAVFRHRVLREGRLVLDRDVTARHAFETRAIVEYLDWKPTHDIAMEATLEGLRRRFTESGQ